MNYSAGCVACGWKRLRRVLDVGARAFQAMSRLSTAVQSHWAALQVEVIVFPP